VVSELAAIPPIETVYRGYRFRSRLEARWAVFFDAAGIEWQYEPEGYRLPSGPYLPDFWLPKEGMFVEVKPTEEARKVMEPRAPEFVKATGKPLLFITGSPSIHENHELHCYRTLDGVWDEGWDGSWEIDWSQCSFCDGVSFRKYSSNGRSCIPPGIKPIKWSWISGVDAPRVKHAMLQAQQAQFEHGKNGQPKPYTRSKSGHEHSVYVAGSVLEEEISVVAWRQAIPLRYDKRRAEGFIYAGPTIRADNHGVCTEGLANDCLWEVSRADALFVWIDRLDTVGTVAEVGAAHAEKTPIFAAFTEQSLADHFYFVNQLSTVSLITDDVKCAWELFTRWMAR
jgi:hypothetical protein